jgi:hypothetical protein
MIDQFELELISMKVHVGGNSHEFVLALSQEVLGHITPFQPFYFSQGFISPPHY